MTVRGPVVVALGDSITFGVGDGTQRPEAVTGVPVGWAAHVAHAVGASSFTNLAANGARARHLGLTQVPSALMAVPDLVLVTIGGNDVLRGDFDPAEVQDRVADALTRLEREGRRVVLVTLARIGLFDLVGGSIADVMARRVAAANIALRLAAAGTATVVVDGAAALATAGGRGWHVDRVHPSAAGHRAIAVEVLGALGDAAPQMAPLVPAPASPRWHERAWWLARHGTPWVAKRSRDLIPQVAAVVTHELLEERRRTRRAHA
ncbi:SGNH/GDSL hydrolase family protein [Demequina capsici]|uniref:SGNH/GDSL hydrolase family protein n=1 Tax=Demequina capsici TaxID=3075620 RepID=A0AA96F8Y7_9MICO|nr:SGNH/GDSL hydrolase family protein [Demequina sp. OYTSA14]WNM25429.1 SGNH/GDSL hydrolase family protein [Demequina sp. OYTSA14]